VGIGPGADFDKKTADPAIKAGLLRAAASTDRILRERYTHLGRQINGWQQKSEVGRYPDYVARATMALMGGAGANLPEDAVYPRATVDADGKPLNGRNRYVLRFEKGQTPPVDGFWSLSVYGTDQNFVANPLKRFNIGDRTKGLTYGDNGSLTIYIQAEPPPKEQQSNRLPAPADCFVLYMRAYAPRKAILDLSYQWPPVHKVK
jgi:hypothetical protein